MAEKLTPLIPIQASLMLGMKWNLPKYKKDSKAAFHFNRV